MLRFQRLAEKIFVVMALIFYTGAIAPFFPPVDPLYPIIHFFPNVALAVTLLLIAARWKRVLNVVIRETEKEYVLEVIAPGFAKEDFQVSLDKNILTVSAEKKTENANENEKLVRREYKFGSFKRSFTIDEKIAADGIAAQYVNGVLLLTLPKREDVKPATKQINIQ